MEQTEPLIKKKKRPGRQARERKKAGLPTRARPTKDRAAAAAPLTEERHAHPWPEKLKERWLKCADCSVDFAWTVDEQDFFKERGFAYVKPTRCFDCRKANKKNFGALNSGSHCYNCGKNGHRSCDCPEPRRSQACYFCGDEGHIARDCPMVVDGVACFHCGKTGHVSSACPEEGVAASCRHCRGAHLSSECPSAVTWKATQPCRLFAKSGECNRVNCLFAHQPRE